MNQVNARSYIGILAGGTALTAAISMLAPNTPLTLARVTVVAIAAMIGTRCNGNRMTGSVVALACLTVFNVMVFPLRHSPWPNLNPLFLPSLAIVVGAMMPIATVSGYRRSDVALAATLSVFLAPQQDTSVFSLPVHILAVVPLAVFLVWVAIPKSGWWVPAGPVAIAAASMLIVAPYLRDSVVDYAMVYVTPYLLAPAIALAALDVGLAGVLRTFDKV